MARPKGTLTKRQKMYAKERVEGSSPSEAADVAYNCKNANSRSSMAAWAEKQPQVRREIERLMDDMELTDEDFLKQVKEGLRAKVVTNYKGDANETQIPDHKTRHKYLDMVKDMKGLDAPKEIHKKSLNVDIKLNEMSTEDLLKAIGEQKELLEAAMVNENSKLSE